MKYIIYLRVSTEEQDVQAQLHECKSYIRSLPGGKDSEHALFTDPDMTSRVKMAKRTGLMAMLKSMRKDDIVIVYKLDRLSRDVIEMVTIFRMIIERKCQIYSLHDPNCDEFTVGLMGVLAQKERADISLRTKSKLAEKKRQGLRYSGAIPYGYVMDKTQLVEIKRKGEAPVLKPGILIECPKEGFVISLAQALQVQGMSYRLIAARLTELGYRNRTGRPFDQKTIYRILTRTQEAISHAQNE